MFCGAADGTLLPPYVIYPSENMWDTWTIREPQGLCAVTAHAVQGERSIIAPRMGGWKSHVLLTGLRQYFCLMQGA